MSRPISLTLLLLLAAYPALGQERVRNELPALTVNGTGEVRTAPDEATVRLGVVRQAATAAEAQQQVNRTAEAILSSLTQAGLKPEQIQTSELSLQPVYAPQRPNAAEEPRIVAYRASNVVTARLDRLLMVGQVIDAGLKAGANQVDSLQFGLRNDLPVRQRALAEAVREAREKARTIAEALEVRLVRVLEVQEGGFAVRPVFAGRAALGAAEAGTPVSPGQVSTTATVTVRYQIQER